MKKAVVYLIIFALVCLLSVPVLAAKDNAAVGINVLLNTEVNDDVLKTLGKHGKVLNVFAEIDALTMRVKLSELEEIKALPFVASANPDAERKGSPIDTIKADSMIDGLSTWNLDAINVTDFGFANRTVEQDGSGVYVAVLDTGLVSIWKQYFPEERIAEEYAISFGGGGGQSVTVSEQPNKWEHDTSSHGTHVTSTILGYSLNGTPVNGVAPNATIIPVKVLNQNGSGWSSVITQGIMYVTELKKGELADSPVVINMSLGGRVLDPLEKAAIDEAIAAGVIIVASAGNEGMNGMGYPGAYAPVISVAAAGNAIEWEPVVNTSWWWNLNMPELGAYPDYSAFYYITDFSSRLRLDLDPNQDLDVAAPGSWIVGPYNPSQGKTSYYFMGGTSMASPHVAGVVALMAEKNPSLTANQAEIILESSAHYMSPSSMDVLAGPVGPYVTIEWGADATGSGMVDAQEALDMIP